MVKFCFSFLLLSLALAVGGCGGAKSSLQTSIVPGGNIECEGHAFSGVVLLSSDNARYLEKGFSPLWNPSTNDVSVATGKIAEYLRRLHPENAMTAEEISQIRARLPKTVCQAVGITFGDQKAILLNCLPAKGVFTQPWRERFIKVFDGGSHYWNVIYIPERDSFVNLKINGWA